MASQTEDQAPITARSVLEGLDSEGDIQTKDNETNSLLSDLSSLRTSSIDTKSIFGFCFVCPAGRTSWAHVYGFTMMIIALFIQTVIPIAIIVTRQPILDVEESPQACPNRGSGFTKVIGFVLSLYFVTLVISLCTNKLRGLGFLLQFVHLGKKRAILLMIGIVSQFVGMGGAGGAQFLLFIGNGGKSYVILVLQSLAMNFCLTVDQQLVGHQMGKYTSSRIAKVSEDSLICNVGVGSLEDDDDGEGGGKVVRASVPPGVASKINLMIQSEKMVLLVVMTTGIAWCATLAYCI